MDTNYFVQCQLHLRSLLLSDSHRIDSSAIRRSWLNMVNALANLMLGRFYTARNSNVHFARLAYGITKAGEQLKIKR